MPCDTRSRKCCCTLWRACPPGTWHFLDQRERPTHLLNLVTDFIGPCGLRGMPLHAAVALEYVRALRARGMADDDPLYPMGWRGTTVRSHVTELCQPLIQLAQSDDLPNTNAKYLVIGLAEIFGFFPE